VKKTTSRFLTESPKKNWFLDNRASPEAERKFWSTHRWEPFSPGDGVWAAMEKAMNATSMYDRTRSRFGYNPGADDKEYTSNEPKHTGEWGVHNEEEAVKEDQALDAVKAQAEYDPEAKKLMKKTHRMSAQKWWNENMKTKKKKNEDALVEKTKTDFARVPTGRGSRDQKKQYQLPKQVKMKATLAGLLMAKPRPTPQYQTEQGKVDEGNKLAYTGKYQGTPIQDRLKAAIKASLFQDAAVGKAAKRPSLAGFLHNKKGTKGPKGGMHGGTSPSTEGQSTRLEDVERIDELSTKKLTDYMYKSKGGRGENRKRAMDRMGGAAKMRHPSGGKTMQTYRREETLDELSPATLGKYIPRAADSGATNYHRALKAKSQEATSHFGRKGFNRQEGIKRATRSLQYKIATKEETINEVAPPGREDQVKELKKKFPKQSAFKIAWHSYNHRKSK
jgi:hypothetical protein